MRILLIGRNGQIGYELVQRLGTLGEVTAIGRQECDLTDRVWLRTTVRLTEPQLIVNAAAYTAVDQAEQEPDVARAINAIAPEVLAEEAAQLGAALVHYSTDYVFDGEKRAPYVENDGPNPLNVYGASKLEGEQAIRSTPIPAMILRTSWVYSLRAENFVSKVFLWAKTKPELRIVADQVSRPTWAVRVADATVRILKQCVNGRGFSPDYHGVYHLASSGTTSRYGWAKAILHHSAHEPPPRVVPTLSNEFPTPAARPRYTALDCTRLDERFGIRLPDWRDDLSLALSARYLPAEVAAKLAIA